MAESDKNQGIYLGSRGDDFKMLIINLLKMGNLKTKYIKILTEPDSMKLYGSAFTSEMVDPNNNYQVAEQVGDVAANKAIVVYMYKRFPELDCPAGVPIVARLRINYGAKQTFSEIARKLGFWPFISATNDLRKRKMKPLLEDVFEAFLGTTERIIDDRKCVGVGYAIVYNILSSIFDKMDISLRFEDLYDAKTRLKELFDMFGSSLGPLVYVDKRDDMIQCSSVFRVEGGKYQEKPDGSVNKNRIIGGRYIEIGRGKASLKADAQQNAAADALHTLNKQGWKKPVPDIYNRFNNEDVKNDILDINIVKKTWGDDMNSLQLTREKTRYQSNYMSTPLAKYSRERNATGVEICLDLGGDPNTPDSEGMFTLDLLFIGSVDEKLVEKIMTLLLKKGDLKMTRAVFDMYYTQYIGKYFSDIVDRITVVENL